jgi:hypothetical protein
MDDLKDTPGPLDRGRGVPLPGWLARERLGGTLEANSKKPAGLQR